MKRFSSFALNLRMRASLIDALQEQEGFSRIGAGIAARRIEDADPADLSFAVNSAGAASTTAPEDFRHGVYVYALAVCGCEAARYVGGPVADFFKGILDWLADPANQQKIIQVIQFIMTVIVPLFI